jgi:hypothetical protein
MALQLVDRVWMLAERLYIHTHSVEDFLTFLNAFGVVYPGQGNRMSALAFRL